MGYAKYFEDNEKITGGRKYEREIEYTLRAKEIYYDCYYCDKSFSSSENRNNHIRGSHNTLGPLLFINGKIATNETYVDSIESAKIILCGFNNITIYVDYKEIKNANSDIDLGPYFDLNQDSHLIKIDQKKFRIFIYKDINISNDEIDEIIESWGKQTEKSQPLKPSQGSYPTNLNEAERQYLNGFFEYYTACETKNFTDKKNRYESAFGILSKFNKLTPRARVLLKVIAFKFNWIITLENFSKENQTKGVFHITTDFFYGRESEIPRNEGIEKKFFIENDVEECLDVILAYQNKDWGKVDTFLTEWTDEKLDKIGDSNKKDKIYLLKARRVDETYLEKIITPFLKKIKDEY
jgi:hypothetical protein